MEQRCDVQRTCACPNETGGWNALLGQICDEWVFFLVGWLEAHFVHTCFALVSFRLFVSLRRPFCRWRPHSLCLYCLLSRERCDDVRGWDDTQAEDQEPEGWWSRLWLPAGWDGKEKQEKKEVNHTESSLKAGQQSSHREGKRLLGKNESTPCIFRIFTWSHMFYGLICVMICWLTEMGSKKNSYKISYSLWRLSL